MPKALAWAAVCVIGIGLMTFNIDRVFAWLTQVAVAVMQGLGLNVQMPELQPDAFPFWDSAMMVLSIVAMILMTRKYVENWLLWVVIDVISVAIFAYQGCTRWRWVCHSDADCPEWLLAVDQERRAQPFQPALVRTVATAEGAVVAPSCLVTMSQMGVRFGM